MVRVYVYVSPYLAGWRCFGVLWFGLFLALVYDGVQWLGLWRHHVSDVRLDPGVVRVRRVNVLQLVVVTTTKP